MRYVRTNAVMFGICFKMIPEEGRWKRGIEDGYSVVVGWWCLGLGDGHIFHLLLA